MSTLRQGVFEAVALYGPLQAEDIPNFVPELYDDLDPEADPDPLPLLTEMAKSGDLEQHSDGWWWLSAPDAIALWGEKGQAMYMLACAGAVAGDLDGLFE